ncbi:hypothetical protein D3C72_2406370 [compost metagenome]
MACLFHEFHCGKCLTAFSLVTQSKRVLNRLMEHQMRRVHLLVTRQVVVMLAFAFVIPLP